jgi:UDP-N-acetylmuramate--alanine ligase
VLDSYAHHPAELAADLAAVREVAGSAGSEAAGARPEDPAAFGGSRGRILALFQPHLYSRTLHLAHGFAQALAAADAVCVTEIYPAREEPQPGVSGRLIVDELARLRPGMLIGWAPELEDAVRFVAGWAHAGDTVLTLGAGDVDRAAPLILEALA